MKDPYLIPGAMCEVWNKSSMIIIPMYFMGYKNNKAIFVHKKEIMLYKSGFKVKGCENYYDYYRVLNTEWTFAPNWAVCSTVDADGRITLWSIVDVKYFFSEYTGGGYWNNTKVPFNTLHCGICPDKTRYEGDAWKTSLRMRPDWAK